MTKYVPFYIQIELEYKSYLNQITFKPLYFHLIHQIIDLFCIFSTVDVDINGDFLESVNGSLNLNITVGGADAHLIDSIYYELPSEYNLSSPLTRVNDTGSLIITNAACANSSSLLEAYNVRLIARDVYGCDIASSNIRLNSKLPHLTQ